MKEKIFAALKQAYSSLGLGDEVLQAHAETLNGMGFVNEDNLQTVIDSQKQFLETLQKVNDKRATDAASKALAKAKQDADEAKAAEEAARKAKEEAEEAEKAKMAKEEAERKKLEDLKRQTEIPEWYKKAQEERLSETKSEREAAQKEAKELKELIKQLAGTSKQQAEEYKKQIEEYSAASKTQGETIKQLQETIQRQAEEAKAKAEAEAVAKAKAERIAKIQSKAKELGITKERIEEGFVIAEDADDAAIETYLTKVANNQKATQLPFNLGYTLQQEGKPTKEEVSGIAASLVDNL